MTEPSQPGARAVNLDREALELECQLRLIDHIDQCLPPDKPIDLWIDGFWAGVRAGANPRSVDTLQLTIDMRRARAAGLTK